MALAKLEASPTSPRASNSPHCLLSEHPALAMGTREGLVSSAQREVRGWPTGDDGLFDGAVDGFGEVSDAHDAEMINLNLGVGMNVNIRHASAERSAGASSATVKGGSGGRGGAAARAQSPANAEERQMRIGREEEGMARIGNNKSMQRERWRFHHRVAAVLKDIWQSLQKLGRGQRDMTKTHYIQMHLAVQQEVNEHMLDPHESSSMAEEDWNKASQGFASLDFDRFSIAWYARYPFLAQFAKPHYPPLIAGH